MNFLRLLLALAFAFTVGNARSEPIMFLEAGGIRVTLYDEPCALDAVSNLPYRATWETKNEKFEGCFGDGGGIVGFYFSDRSVVFIPAGAFLPAIGI